MAEEGARKRTIVVIVACIVVAAAITVVRCADTLSLGSYTTSWGERIFRGEQYLTIEGETFTQEDLEHVAGMRELRQLELKNCNIAECRLPDLSFASENLYSVSFEGTALWDTSFLAHLQAENLTLTDCAGVESLADLNWDVLDDLNVDGTDISDLSPAKGSHLWELSFARTDVSDLEPLAHAELLCYVDGSYTKVSSIDALADAGRLTELHFDGCPIRSVGRRFASERLHTISLANTDVRDLSCFTFCTDLRELSIAGCRRIKSMDWLGADARSSLRRLNVAQTGLTPDDLGWVASCRDLEQLTLDGIDLGDLSLCKDLHELTALSAVGCGLTDISGIRKCEKLESILLGYNHIEDVSVVPLPVTEYPTLELDLSHNQIDSFADLPKGSYRLLMIQGNGVDAGRTIAPGVESYMVAVSWFSGMEDSRIAAIDSFSHIYLLDCPPDEVDNVAQHFYAHRYDRVSEEKLLELLEANDLTYWLDTDFGWYASYVRDAQLREK